ncbi:energy-coupling factor transporter transmembrane component T [Nocardioides marmorisolisilvae]|uniref:Energy-coupling factor transporter transmembrane protein EcfT n=1 Tax=Nocardioides marmorisolisilvae TaxID=1542737 RepID=A0A3N0DTI6_9ACTN|nr:energy-coupling factor transporter transmembrane component T [Nocardioides marmorisolisilvae]RNL78713.1 energy-coupling factor transporter transmembrane protein EcfT [Nocardioides marmorisolisilvae]
MNAQLPRALHPLAWWGWAIGLAVAASMTTNPLLLALILGVVTLVVAARRSDSPWARAFRIYVGLGIVIVLFRVVLHVLVGFKWGDHKLFDLPTVGLPDWAAGINVLGPVYLEGWLAAVLEGVKLATLVIAIGGANALANPKRLLRSMPNALHEVGTAVVVSVSVAPQLAESVQRVYRARLLRGESGLGLRALSQVALPVLQDTLDRSLMLAAAMESRGYGSRREADGTRRLLTGTLTLGGLLALAFGMYGVLDSEHTTGHWGVPLLVLGLLSSAGGLALGGREVRVTSYRSDPWRLPETLTVLSGVVTATAMGISRNVDSHQLVMPLQPIAAPTLPLLATVGILIAALPAFVTPPTPSSHRAAAPVRRELEEVAG